MPLLRGDWAIGIFQIRRSEVKAFTEQQIALVETFARQAAVAIENARLFTELHKRLEEQTATGDILRFIASNPGELQPILDGIVERVAHLCRASRTVVALLEPDDPGAFRHGASVADGELRSPPSTARPASSCPTPRRCPSCCAATEP